MSSPAVTNTSPAEWVQFSDGTPVFTKTWISVIQPPRATVVFVHGMGEHIGRYNEVFEQFIRSGITVFGYDQRGFGRTGRREDAGAVLGHAEGFDTTMNDVDMFVRRTKMAGVPQFLMGHSMGGNIVLNYAASGKSRHSITGVIASAPFLATTTPISDILVSATSILSKFMGAFTIHTEIAVENLCRDSEVCRKYTADWLVHDIISIRTISELVSKGKSILESKFKEIRLPLYVVHGTKDNVTSYLATVAFVEKVKSVTDTTFRSYDGGYHELHNEPSPLKELCIQEYIDWIDSRVEILAKIQQI